MSVSFCSSCGNQLSSNDQFCPNCGKAVQNQSDDNLRTVFPTYNVTQPKKYPGRGTLILVLGILTYFPHLGLFTGIPAWIMGNTDLKRIEKGQIPASEKKNTKIGMILGQAYVYILIFGGIFMILFFKDEVKQLMGVH